MTRISVARSAGLAFIFVMSSGTFTQAGIIEQACNSSDRQARTSTLCACIQAVADQVLTPAEQKRGAAFFKDPHSSQETRTSDDPNDEVFWLKWKSYGEAASELCR